MLFERLGGADRRSDVAEARHPADRARSDAVRRDVALVDAPVLEAQDVAALLDLLAEQLALGQLHQVFVLQARSHPFDDQVESAAGRARSAVKPNISR